MDISQRSTNILKLFSPYIRTIDRKTQIWTLFLILLIVLGGYALYLQIVVGHDVTGMRDNASWGLYIANFIFFIGLSYSAAILAAVLYFFKIPWGRPIIRISALMALISGIIGPFFILLCIGRFDRLHMLFFKARVQSPITWDVMVISTYLVGITTFVLLLHVKDFAVLRDTQLIDFPNWRRKLYRFLALGYKGKPAQEDQLDKSTNTMAFIMLPKVILAFSVLGWIFGMTLRPGWHSTIFGPSYVVASCATGVGLIITLMWFFRKRYGLEDYIMEKQFIKMGYIMLFIVAIYGYFVFSQFVTNWYVSGKWDTRVMAKKMDFSEYGWWYLISNFFAIILPIIVVSIKKFRTIKNIVIASALMVVAMWIHRYLIVVPTLETPLLPIQDTRPEYIHYSATWIEWVLTLAGVATFLLFFTVMTKLITVLPLVEWKKK